MKPRTDTKKHENETENEFTLGGKRYVARGFDPCRGCVFADFPGECNAYARPPCDSMTRKDGRNVVFVCAGKADAGRRRPRGA